MPILSSAVFDDTGKPYDVSRILTPDFLFDRVAYEKYSKVYLPITYVLAYAVQFAGLSALVTHTACWHGMDVWEQTKRSFNEQKHSNKSEYQPVGPGKNQSTNETPPNTSTRAESLNEPGSDRLTSGEDVHTRLMRRYEDAPVLWYLMTFLVMLAVGIFVVE